MSITIEGGAFQAHEPYTLPANYQECFDALPAGVYVKCARCQKFRTDCDITIETINTERVVTCELCAKGIVPVVKVTS